MSRKFCSGCGQGMICWSAEGLATLGASVNCCASKGRLVFAQLGIVILTPCGKAYGIIPSVFAVFSLQNCTLGKGCHEIPRHWKCRLCRYVCSAAAFAARARGCGAGQYEQLLRPVA